MGMFDFLLGKLERWPAAEHSGDGVAREPKYDPRFIARLTHEHRALLTLFGQIREAHAAGDPVAVKRALQQFLLALERHLARENSHFYAYLHVHLRKNTPEHVVMSTFRSEMQEIARIVSAFLRKYLHAELTPDLLAAFGPELQQLGSALATRMQDEERTLYRLYRPMPDAPR